MKFMFIFLAIALVASPVFGQALPSPGTHGSRSDPFGTRWYGNETSIGDFTFGNMYNNRGDNYRYQENQIGNFRFHRGTDSFGNTRNCTTTYIGNTAFTNCY